MTESTFIILGTDAVLAAAPASPVQLAHACLAAGFQLVVPASWGDELVAARAVERLRAADGPVVQCSCPYVARLLADHGDAIAPLVLFLTSPPVAAAEYLRAVYSPARPRITYAGGCPAATHASIDEWLSPQELATMLARRGIDISAQPTEFDSVIPPDRRRFFSEPGGVPSKHALRQVSLSLELGEVSGADLVVELAQRLLAPAPALLDVAVPLGCCCSGAVGSERLEAARSRVREHEPPRALSPVVDHGVPITLDAEKVVSAAARSDGGVPPSEVAYASPETDVVAEASVNIGRRRSPPGLTRAVLGTMPQTRHEAGRGRRQLPRAYVARRRSSPRGIRESSLRQDERAAEPARPYRVWVLVGASGVLVGLLVAWLLLLVT